MRFWSRFEDAKANGGVAEVSDEEDETTDSGVKRTALDNLKPNIVS